MALTRKHFTAVAKILDGEKNTAPAAGFDEGYETARSEIAEQLADYFARENANFDRQKFLNASGVQ